MHRHRMAGIALALALVGSGLSLAIVGARRHLEPAPIPPASPPIGDPTPVCGSDSILNGPSSPPTDSVTVNPGQSLNSLTQAYPAGTTFWLAPGTHTLGTSPFDQVGTKDNDTYLGAPGAVLSGQGINYFAFSGEAQNVTIRYLTVTGFMAPNNQAVVNTNAAPGWHIDHNTVANNKGVGVFTGSNVTIAYNCIDSNGQHGLGGYRPAVLNGSAITNVYVDHNEISRNDTDDWETQVPGCGCSGGVKFWDTGGGVVTNNWIHHNKSVGLWVDQNNVGFRIEANTIEDNEAEGLFYEISYNGVIRNNVLKRNTLVKGQAFAARGDTFPIGSMYISESGGDARVNGGVYSTLEISGNYFENNWSGVVLYEGANRFCNSPANPSSYCTKVNPAVTTSTCVAGTINNPPYYGDCRWKTQNVLVQNNQFRMDKAAIGCTSTFCGRQGLLSDWGSYPTWSPYTGNVIKDAITYQQNNVFRANTYVGDWRFRPYDSSRDADFSAWRSAPYNQDAGSTLNGTSGSTTTPGNYLDADTAGLEGSVGHWTPWYSTSIARSTAQAKAGAASLNVTVTANSGWGVALNNWPGFPTTAGPKTVSFWALMGSGSNLGVTMNVKWRDGSGADLQVDTIALSTLTTTWQQGSAALTAPAGTKTVTLAIVSPTGIAGTSVDIDEVSVRDTV